MTFQFDAGEAMTELVLLVVVLAVLAYVLSFIIERAVKKGTLAAMREFKREEADRDGVES